MLVKNKPTKDTFLLLEALSMLKPNLCHVIALCLSIGLLTISLCFFNQQHFLKTQFPTDSLGNVCSQQQGNRQFLFFQNPKNLFENRFCVKNCPQRGENVQCIRQDQQCNSIVAEYSTQNSEIYTKEFCLPKQQSQLLHKKNLMPQFISINHGLKIIINSLIFSMIGGFIYLVLSPLKQIFYVISMTNFILTIILGLWILTHPLQITHSYLWELAIGLTCILVNTFLIAFIGIKHEQIQELTLYMKAAGKFIYQRFATQLFHTMNLILATFLFLCVIFWQNLSFQTIYAPTLPADSLYYISNGVKWLKILNVFELIWGLTFLQKLFTIGIFRKIINQYLKVKIKKQNINFQNISIVSFLNDLHCFNLKYVRIDAYPQMLLKYLYYLDGTQNIQLKQYSSKFQTGLKNSIKFYKFSIIVWIFCLISLTFITFPQLLPTKIFLTIFFGIGIYSFMNFFIELHLKIAQTIKICVKFNNSKIDSSFIRNNIQPQLLN